MIPKFIGKIQFGKLTLEDEPAYDSYLLTLEGEVEVTVRKRSKKRTLSQNQYYWGVVVRLISDETGHTSEEIHELLKSMFLKDLIEIRGEVYDTVKSTSNLDTQGFSQDYIDRIKQWAWDKLQLIIPEPDTVE